MTAPNIWAALVEHVGCRACQAAMEDAGFRALIDWALRFDCFAVVQPHEVYAVLRGDFPRVIKPASTWWPTAKAAPTVQTPTLLVHVGGRWHVLAVPTDKAELRVFTRLARSMLQRCFMEHGCRRAWAGPREAGSEGKRGRGGV